MKSILFPGLIILLLNQSFGQDTASIMIKLKEITEYAFFQERDYFVWGASMIKENDSTYHLFYSRWPDSLGFNAWVTHSEIAHAVSNNALGPYHFSDVSLKSRGKSYWDGLCTHNPTIHKFGNKYYLYYMGNTGNGINMPELNFTHRNNQRIGVAMAESPYGPWERHKNPLIDVSIDTSKYDALCVSNPCVIKTDSNRYMIIYKAVGLKNELPFGGLVVHLSAISDHPDGQFIKNGNPLFTSKKSNFSAEDPNIFKYKAKYYAILKDMNGSFNENGKSLVLFESIDGEVWNLSINKQVSLLQLKYESGELRKVDRLERPQVYSDHEGIPEILFLAVKEGDKTYNVHIPIEIIEEQ